MKRVIPIILVLGMLIVLILWRTSPPRDTKLESDQPPPDRAASSGQMTSTPAGVEPTNPATATPKSSQGTASLDAVMRSLQAGIDRYNEDWKKPIRFYGRVLDERDQPVAGAAISFVWNDLSPEGASKSNTLSDANGFFRLEEVIGRGVAVAVSKEGYYEQRRGAQFFFEYARDYEPEFHRPDPNNPVVFRLRKKGEGAELITSKYGVIPDLNFSTPLDGTPVEVDFYNRKAGASGQMEVRAIKPPRDEDVQATEWFFSLRIPDGGLVEHNAEFPFEAPESGYQPTVEFRFKAGETNWSNDLKKEYYIAFGSPRKYGRIKLRTGMYMGVRLEYAINPTGSRDLEPKEQKLARPELPPGAVEVNPFFRQ